MNTQRLSPQGYNINTTPLNSNPFWETEGTGGNVPAGGTTGQVLTKRTDADYDTEWTTPQGGGGADWPAGGQNGDLLAKSGTGAEWVTPNYATAASVTELQAEVDAKADAADVTALSGRVSTAEEDIDNILTILENVPTDERMDAVEADILNLQNDMDTVEGIQSAQATTIESIAGQVNTNTADITALKSRMSTAEGNITSQAAEDTRLAGLIADEATARTDADTLIRSDIADDIDDEAAARAAEDTRLAGLISAETTARTDADTAIRGQIAAMSGLPAGGTTGQVLTKTSDSDFAAGWEDPSGGEEVNGLPTLKRASDGSVIVLEDSPYSTYSNRTFLPFARFPSSVTPFKKWVDVSSLLGGVSDGGNDLTMVVSGSTNPIQGVTSYNVKGRAAPFLLPGTQASDPTRQYYNMAPAGALIAKRVNVGAGVNASGIYTNSIAGGTTGQVLTKNSDADYDWTWETPAGGEGLPSGGSAGNLLQMSASGNAQWWAPTYAQQGDLQTVSGDLDDAEAAITTLQGRMTTAETDIDNAEGDIDALDTRVTTAEGDIVGVKADIAELTTDVGGLGNITTYGQVQNVSGTNPSFLALPFVNIEKDGTTDTTAAPDGWAQYYTGSTPAGALNCAPIFFDCNTWPGGGVGSGALALDNSTYGGSHGKIYIPINTGISTAVQKSFTLPGETGDSSTLEIAVKLRNTENSGLNVEGNATITINKTAATDAPYIASGKFRVTDSNVDYVRGGSPDFYAVLINNGAGSYVCRLGFAHDFFRWLGSHYSNAYRWTVSQFGIHKLIGKY